VAFARSSPSNPSTVGVRATQANETWHVDTSILRLLDGTRAYLHAVIDNYSRKILAWTVAARLDPTATCQLLLAAGRHLVFAGRPLLYADSGVENVNGAVEGRQEPRTCGASCREPSDVLRSLSLSASQPSRLGDSSMNLVLTLLRTPKYGMSAHAATLRTGFSAMSAYAAV
jgi:transposase InsO family protein